MSPACMQVSAEAAARAAHLRNVRLVGRGGLGEAMTEDLLALQGEHGLRLRHMQFVASGLHT
jgi:hypothetical protein